MSREEDIRAAEGFATKYHDIELIRSEPKLFRYGVNTFMAGIAYGRATQREMLKRFIEYLSIKSRIEVFIQDETIDEFLTLENQRGENGM